MLYRYVDEWAVIAMADGRVGSFTRNGPDRKPVVMLAGNRGVRVRLSDECEVIKWPAQLAGEYVEAVNGP